MQLKKEPPELLNKGLNDHVALVAVAFGYSQSHDQISNLHHSKSL